MKNKLITFLVVIMMLLVLVPSSIYAKMDTSITLGTTNDLKASEPITKRVLGVLQIAGSIISVVALIIIGIRYMVSSTEEKANLKGVIMYYVIGAILVFATSNFVGFAYTIISSL